MIPPAMSFRIVATSLCAVVLGGTATFAADAGRDGFDQNIKPFFNSYCTKCHGPKKAEQKLTLHDIRSDISSPNAVDRWHKILEQIELGEMPPEDEKQPSTAARRQMVEWITAELKRTGNFGAIAAKRNNPSYGNHIDHDELFSGKHKGPAYSPSRLWRISPYISDKKPAYLRTRTTPAQPFNLADTEGLKDYASMWRLDGPTLELLLINANEVVNKQIGPSPEVIKKMDAPYLAKGGHPARKPSNRVMFATQKDFHAIAYGDKPPTKKQIEQVVLYQCNLATGRAPSQSEKTRYEELLATSIRGAGNMEGLRAVLTAILMAPESIYRMELGLGEKTEDGRRMLSAQELSFALSYALRDIGPDGKILADAKSGKLLDREIIAGHVRRMIDEEQTYHYRRTQAPRYLRFFQEFFGYTGAPQVFKDGSRQPGYKPVMPGRLVDDTHALIQHIVKQDKDVLKELLTTDEVAVYTFQKDFRLTYRAYGISRKEVSAYGKEKKKAIGSGRGLFNKSGERVGILTQPSWLIAHSQNFDNDVVIRGKWIYERLLAGTIPDVPIEVDATVPADHDKSLRERMKKTRADYCWKCHHKMNPYGLAFESYDDVGRFRTKELLRDNKTFVPVVTTSEIANSGAPGLDGSVKDINDLMHKLAKSPRVRQSFIRHVFRYYMGRNETLDDSPTLIAADKAYVKSGGSMKELVVSLLTSDSFLYRK